MPSGVLNYQAKNLYVNLRCLRQRAVGDTMSVTTDRKAVIPMLNENIKTIRKSKGLSQEELAVKLNVVRQTVSKWEQGLSVPDSDMLTSLSDALGTPVSTLLGENVAKQEADELKTICEKLEVINLQLVQRKTTKIAAFHCLFIALCVATVLVSAVLIALNSPYLGWNFGDPETAVFGTVYHVFEWLFVRFASIAFVGSLVGAFMTRKKW